MSFSPDYYTDRRAFVSAVTGFAERTGRSLRMHSFYVDESEDLQVTFAELLGRQPERLHLLTTGIHGVEGYTGSAIARALLSGALTRLSAESTSLVVVHALNPYGMARFIRVNRNNVDLNRNCQAHHDSLFTTDSSDFTTLAGLLAPKAACDDSLLRKVAFRAGMLAALPKHGMKTMRQATLGGQYVDPQGTFYGGDCVQPEIAYFQEQYERLARTHREVLLTDVHTGYGDRGLAYALFGRADSPEFRAYTEEGVKDKSGRDRTYTVHGDLVGYCHSTHKRVRGAGTFNGVAVELGTHALTLFAQMQDLYTVVRENQVRHHGAVRPSTSSRAASAFRELFYPSDPTWQAKAIEVGSRQIEELLRKRSYL
jgi:hypothetical protein